MFDNWCVRRSVALGNKLDVFVGFFGFIVRYGTFVLLNARIIIREFSSNGFITQMCYPEYEGVQQLKLMEIITWTKTHFVVAKAWHFLAGNL